MIELNLTKAPLTTSDPIWPGLLRINKDLTNEQRWEAYTLLSAMELCYPNPVDIRIVRPDYTITLSGLRDSIDSVTLNVIVMRVPIGSTPPYPIVASANYHFRPSKITLWTDDAVEHLVTQLVSTGQVLLGRRLYLELISSCDILSKRVPADGNLGSN